MPMNLGLGLGLGVQNSFFSIENFMASQADGLWFDTTKTDRYFQESTGPTLADDVGEAMGLALDQRSWAGLTPTQITAAQSELVANPTATGAVAGSPGTAPTNWNVSGSDTFGLTRTIAVGTDGTTGLPYIDVRWQGTASSSGFLAMDPQGSGAAAPVASLGQSFTYTSYIALVAGSLATAATATFGVQGRDSGNVAIAGSAVSILGATSTPTVFANKIVHQVTSSSVAKLTTEVRVQITNGNVYDFTLRIIAPSNKRFPGNHGVQATGSLKPLRQTTGAKFDGSDDNWLTPYLTNNGANFVVALVTMPASAASTQLLFGAANAASLDEKFFIGVTSAGLVRAGIGTSTIGAGSNMFGQRLVIGATTDKTTDRVFQDTSEVYSGAFAGALNNIATRVGAMNAGGAAANYFSGAVEKLVAGREYLTLSRYLQIRSRLLDT